MIADEPEIVVIGDALLDVRAAPSEPMRPGGDVPGRIRMLPGGQGANVAVRLARRGRRVRLVCAIGDEPAGQIVRGSLAADGVAVHDVGADRPGIVVVVIDGDGDRTMLSDRAPLLRRPLPPDVVSGAAWLVVSGYVLLERDWPPPAGDAVPRRAVLGCSLTPGQSADWLAAAASVAPHLVVLNVDEARVLAGHDGEPVQLSAELGRRMAAIVIVTHPRGAAASLGGRSVESAAPTAASIVDTTGSGDAFAAGVISGLVDAAWPPPADRLERAMAEATALATAVAGVPGAQGRVAAE